MPAGEELQAAPRLAGPSFISREASAEPKGPSIAGKQDEPLRLGALPSSQDSSLRGSPGRPAHLPPSQDSSLRGCLGSFSHPKSRGQQMLKASPRATHPHTSSANFRGGLPDPPLSAPPPQDSRHLSPEFLQKWGVSHTLAEKGSHLPPRRCGVLGLRAPPRASPVCSLPLDLCVCAP